jgi:hypothetical protein
VGNTQSTAPDGVELRVGVAGDDDSRTSGDPDD